MIKAKAYRAVRTALAQGVLVRPQQCTRCGRSGHALDGRSIIHAHHHDYTKPLDVEWICAKCHRKETPLPAVIGAPCYGDSNGVRKNPECVRGSNNGFSKLTESQVAEIKARKGENVKDIAKEFNVKAPTIYDILNGRNWKHVAAAPKPEDVK